MSIASECTRLTNAKRDIRAAIIGKGVSVPESSSLSNYASFISSISSGDVQVISGSTLGNDSNSIVVSCGFRPDIVYVFAEQFPDSYGKNAIRHSIVNEYFYSAIRWARDNSSWQANTYPNTNQYYPGIVWDGSNLSINTPALSSFKYSSDITYTYVAIKFET